MSITSDIYYPSQLPVPIKSGYGVKYEDGRISTKLASGRRRVRPLFQSVPAIYSVNFVFNNNAEVMLFEGFYAHALKEGTRWFNMKLRTPMGFGDYVCRFSEAYEGAEPYGLCSWQASARLEMWERPIIVAEWVDFPDYILEADIIDIALNEKWPIA